ncbi:MAG: MBOAT family protein [Lachnoclostridium sp.]|nr:MBOAT family protein [Lachnoclostridium sp.]
MVFSSLVFMWIFLPLVFLGSRILRGKYVNVFLLVSSLLFYAWGEPVYIVLMLFSIFFNYFSAQMIEHHKGNKILLFVVVMVNLGMLGIFKYYNFAVETINSICHYTVLSERNIPLPIGISFYTFQALSYVIDVYLGKIPVQKKLTSLALYISFFPQLIAGPIIQYKDIDQQLEERQITSENTAEGFNRFFIGLGKKVLISNVMASVTDNIFTMDYSHMGMLTAWIGIICYTLQIYYDFSGYSDMAIGLGKMFGFEFCENFKLPYTADSIKDFWTKWHISLSSWFKEYLYIPLGGNRKGTLKTYRNNVLVFLATGIWHGASWNFVIWGLIHGAFLILERMGFSKVLLKIPKLMRHTYTMLVVMVAWVFFRVEQLGLAFDYLSAMFDFRMLNVREYVLSPKEILVVIAAVFFAGFHKVVYTRIMENGKNTWMKSFEAKSVVSIGLYFLAICSLAAGEYNPFIYFRF